MSETKITNELVRQGTITANRVVNCSGFWGREVHFFKSEIIFADKIAFEKIKMPNKNPPSFS